VLDRSASAARSGSRTARARAAGRIALTLGLIAGAWLSAAAPASADPLVARGSSPSAAGGQARAKATSAARRAALELALDEIARTTAVDAAARRAVLAQAEVWTGAYRVLGQTDLDGTLAIELEVEVDLPRLRKRVLPADPGGASNGLRWSRFEARGCDGVDVDSLRVRLVAAGIVREGTATAGGRALTLALTCSLEGAVPHTFLTTGRARVDAAIDGKPRARVGAFGFASSPIAALADALDRATDELTRELELPARGGTRLLVRSKAPGSALRELERRLREAVEGVTRVDFDGLEPDGTLRLHVFGAFDTATLASRLDQLAVPGARVVSPRAEGEGTVRLSLEPAARPGAP
jgi:hypothetical protein